MKTIYPKIKRSVIWKITDEEFVELVLNSKSMSQVLAYFNLKNKGGNYLTCKERISKLNIKTEHFSLTNNPVSVKKQVTKEEFEKRLREHSSCKNVHLKKFLIKFNLLEYQCAKCKNSGLWEGQSLSLQLEHKNGVSDDNTLSNLEFLCPNCHSQTSTFAGKKNKKQFLCEKCESPISRNKKDRVCNKCSGFKKRIENKIKEKISKEELEQLICELPIIKIADIFGVSDNGIRKWCKRYNIDHKSLSKFSHGKQKPDKQLKEFTSRYKYISFHSKIAKWIFSFKKDKVYKRFKSEEEALNFAMTYLKSSEPLLK